MKIYISSVITELFVLMTFVILSIITMLKTYNSKIYVNSINNNEKRLPINIICLSALILYFFKFCFCQMANFFSMMRLSSFENILWFIVGILCVVAMFLLVVQYLKETKPINRAVLMHAVFILTTMVIYLFVYMLMNILTKKINNNKNFANIYIAKRVMIILTVISLMIFSIIQSVKLFKNYKNDESVVVWKVFFVALALMSSILTLKYFIDIIVFLRIISENKTISGLNSYVLFQHRNTIKMLNERWLNIVVAFLIFGIQCFANIPRKKKKVENLEFNQMMQDFDNIK